MLFCNIFPHNYNEYLVSSVDIDGPVLQAPTIVAGDLRRHDADVTSL